MHTEPQVVYEGPIEGISFGHYKFRPDRLKNRDLVVVTQPQNIYDAKAIALTVVNGSMQHHVGFVPHDETWRIHEVHAAGGIGHATCLGTRRRQIQTRHGRADTEEVWVVITTQVRVAAVALKTLRPVGTRRILL